MNILRLPSTTKLRTRIYHRDVQFTYSQRFDGPAVIDNIFTGIENWLEITVNDISEFKTLVTEIDLSSKNRFIIYEESDIDWLLYYEPHRMIVREPRDGDIVQVSIENRRYRAAITIPYFSAVSKYQTIQINATLLD